MSDDEIPLNLNRDPPQLDLHGFYPDEAVVLLINCLVLVKNKGYSKFQVKDQCFI